MKTGKITGIIVAVCMLAILGGSIYYDYNQRHKEEGTTEQEDNTIKKNATKATQKLQLKDVQGTWTSGLLDASEFPALRSMENSSMGKVRMSVIVKGSRATLFYYDSITQIALLQSSGSCIIYDNGEGGELRLDGYNIPFYIDTNLDRETVMHIGNYSLKRR